MALDVPTGYRALKEADVAAYLADVPAVATSIGGKAADWKVREVGDGNLNLVFIVEGPKSGVVLKQALPYVRLVGESWPLSVRRAFFEHQALLAQSAVAPAHVPKLFHFDESPGAHGDGLPQAAYHPAQGPDPRHGLSQARRPHGDLHGRDAVLDLRSRPARRREEEAHGAVLRQYGALPDHRGSGLHRSLAGGRGQSLDQPAARPYRRGGAQRRRRGSGRRRSSN